MKKFHEYVSESNNSDDAKKALKSIDTMKTIIMQDFNNFMKKLYSIDHDQHSKIDKQFRNIKKIIDEVEQDISDVYMDMKKSEK